jgi:hypothetical protein
LDGRAISDIRKIVGLVKIASLSVAPGVLCLKIPYKMPSLDVYVTGGGLVRLVVLGNDLTVLDAATGEVGIVLSR